MQNQKRDRIEIEERAAQAGELLRHPLLLETFAALEQEALSAIRSGVPGDLTSTSACARIKSLDEIRAHLNSIVNDEKVTASRGGPRPFSSGK